MESLSKKITFLNQTTLDCFSEPNEVNIIEKFTEAGIKILGADFGFAWLSTYQTGVFEMAYKSPLIPYEPSAPRKEGTSTAALANKTPSLFDDYRNS